MFLCLQYLKLPLTELAYQSVRSELLYLLCIVHADEYISAAVHMALMVTQKHIHISQIRSVYIDQLATFTTLPVRGNSTEAVRNSSEKKIF